MSIKRYIASKDTTITNGYQLNLITRGTGSNMGASDSLEVYSIFAQQSPSSSELSRMLIEFPILSMSADRSSGALPASGSVNFFLNLYNAEHPFTVPTNFELTIAPVSSSWEEGNGLDMENYSDITRDQVGANWIRSSNSTAWNSQGGDYLDSPSYTQSFDSGLENLEVDITDLVEQWISNNIANYGVGIKLNSSFESVSSSYYTKKFFARGSEYFYKRPIIEARWDSSISDDRGKFIASSSLLTSEENVNTLYLYNYFYNSLRNIPSVGTGSIYVDVYDAYSGGGKINASAITGGYVSTGTYSASFALNSTASILYDVWHDGTNIFYTGTIELIPHSAISSIQETRKYVTSIMNLKSKYWSNEKAKLRLYNRLHSPNISIYTVANQDFPNNIITNGYYRIIRLGDNNEIIPYGTGSIEFTKLSYDVSGNYFDLDMSIFEPDYMYGIKLLYKIGDLYEEQEELFKFRVVSNTQ